MLWSGRTFYLLSASLKLFIHGVSLPFLLSQTFGRRLIDVTGEIRPSAFFAPESEYGYSNASNAAAVLGTPPQTRGFSEVDNVLSPSFVS